MLFLSLSLLLILYLAQVSLSDTALRNVLSRKKRALDDYDDNIFMFRNPNITIPINRTRLTLAPDWMYYSHTSPRSTAYWGQRGLTKEWTTFAWYNDRGTIFLESFLRGLKKAPYTVYPRYRMPSTTPKTTTLSLVEQITLFNKKDLIFKLPWAFLPHQNFRQEMGFGPNDTIDMSKVSMRTIEAFEQKYQVTVMYQWPNTHPGYLNYINHEKYKHTLVFSEEMSTVSPLNLSGVDFEDWFFPQVPRMKLSKVENLEFQLRVLMDDFFELPYLDKHIFVNSIEHEELVKRYKRFRSLRKREYRTWYRRKIWLPWKHLVRDGIRNWFLARDRCVPSPGKAYFDEINKQFECLSQDMNETLYHHFYEFEDAFLHWYSHTYAPRWNLSDEVEQTIPFTIATPYSPATESDEIFLNDDHSGIHANAKRRRRAIEKDELSLNDDHSGFHANTKRRRRRRKRRGFDNIKKYFQYAQDKVGGAQAGGCWRCDA